MKININFLKILAAASMLIDHIGHTIFNREFIWMTAVGRLAFPLFAFVLAYNFYFNTSSRKNYIKRILVFAFISQPFYMGAVYFDQLNIFFTLSLGLICLLFFNADKNKYWFLPFFILPFLWAFLFSETKMPNVDFGIYGVLLIYSFGLFLSAKKYWKKVLSISLIFLFLFLINFKDWSVYSLVLVLSTFISLPLIYVSGHIKQNLLWLLKYKYWFYIFYPGHLFLLWLVKVLTL